MTNPRIEEIERRIIALQHEESALCDALVEAQHAEWEERVDELKVRVHLGAMDLRDRVAPVLDHLRDQISSLRSDVADGDDTTVVEVFDALRRGFSAAAADIAAAARDARTAVAARHGSD